MNENAIERPVTRRRLLAIGLAGGVSLLVGCGAGSRSDAGWTFVDDRGHTLKLRRRPTRIVAYTSAAAALYDWGVKPVGVFGDDPREDPALAGFPWGTTQIVGAAYGEIDPGALHALNADLIVSRWYPPPDDVPVFGFKDLKQQRAIGAQVAIAALNGHVIAAKQIERFGDLSRALGVNTSSGRIGQARAEFAAAEANLARVARQKSKLRIIAISADQNTIFFAKLSDCGDLTFYARRGVPLVSAKTSKPYWETLPWKDAGKYPADAILYDARSGVLPLRDARGITAFAELPAVRANQIAAWQGDPPPSYQTYARTMNDLAKAISGWHKVL
jgi:iron complex transport system substrate-binding protein